MPRQTRTRASVGMLNDFACPRRGLVQTGNRSHLWPPPRMFYGHHFRRSRCRAVQGCWMLGETEQFDPAAPAKSFDLLSLRGFRPLIPLLVLALSGCSDKPPPPAAAAPPPVTVAQPVKRMVTDWDEFTGRFDAVEEVQVRARVGGFVNSVEFRDGAIVHAGDLLYVIELPSIRGGRRAGGRSACGCAGQNGTGQARTRPRPVSGTDQRSL